MEATSGICALAAVPLIYLSENVSTDKLDFSMEDPASF